MRQFGFTSAQLDDAGDDQLFETYRAYGGDMQLLNETVSQVQYDTDELTLYRWRKLANLGD